MHLSNLISLSAISALVTARRCIGAGRHPAAITCCLLCNTR